MSGCVDYVTDAGDRATQNCPSLGGTTLTVTLVGAPLPPASTGLTLGVKVGCDECKFAARAGADAVTCTLAPGRGSSKLVVVEVNGLATIGAFPGVSFAHCPAGSFPDGNACTDCKEGEFGAEGASACTPCPGGTFSRRGKTTCHDCPGKSFGVSCAGGVLTPLEGYWSVGADADAGGAIPFEEQSKKGGVVFPCLSAEHSCTTTNDTATPAGAFACERGHWGPLCAICCTGNDASVNHGCGRDERFYFSDLYCQECTRTSLSPMTIGIVSFVGALVLVFAVHRCCARRHAPKLMRQLKVLRAQLRAVRARHREAARARSRAGRCVNVALALKRAARQLFAEHYFRSNALHCTATSRILIPAECSAAVLDRMAAADVRALLERDRVQGNNALPAWNESTL